MSGAEQAGAGQGGAERGGMRRARRGTSRLVRLRRWLLSGVVVLAVAIAGLVGYARYRTRKALLDLPRLLGVDVKSETDGFTISRTVKGRTLFTIHAAKAIQHRDGKTTLRNVEVTVYGEPGTNREDRIKGSEFEYDQAGGVVRAKGESEIDVASPAGGSGSAGKRVHVLANGLVFDQKQGGATADGAIRFEYGALVGTATGADFDAHTGMLVLRHDVHVTNAGGGERQRVDAASAVLDRVTRVARLHDARVAQDGETLAAAELVVQLRPESGAEAGSIDSVHGSGGVTVRTADGATAEAPLLEAKLTGENKLRTATLTGGVTLHAAGLNGRAEADGHAGAAVLHFDAAGQATGVQMDGGVQLRQMGAEQRELTARTVSAGLGRDAAGHAVLRDSVATGNAVLKLVSLPGAAKPGGAGQPGGTTTLRAEVLRTFGGSVGGRWLVKRVEGDRNTGVEQVLSTGETRTSAADNLQVGFAQAGLLPGAREGAAEISSFVQQGHVHMVDAQPAAGARVAQESVANAQRAEYQASSGLVVLTGSPTVRNRAMQVEASRIAVVRETGNAEASGAVQGSALADGGKGGEPTLFTAERAVMDRGAQQVTLFGGVKLARVWNSTSQVEAPVIDIDQARKTLLAHGAAGASPSLAVRAVLPGRSGAAGEPVRLLGGEARYDGAAVPATVQVTGGVRMDSASGQIVADRATATMGASSGQAGSGLIPGGGLEKIVADGKVRVQEPGRTATGQHLVYTAATQQFVLTGGPPMVRDSVQGTVTGASLLFRAGDDSVEVVGAAGQPVRTEIESPPRQPAKPNSAGKQGRPAKAAGQK